MGKKFTATRSKLRQILSLFNVDLQTSAKIKDGMINSSYFITDHSAKKYVLRIYQQDNRSDREIAHELKTTELFRQANIPIPVVYTDQNHHNVVRFEDKGQTWRVVLMEKAEGKHLVVGDRKVLPQFAQYHAKMHLVSQKQVEPLSTLSTTLKFLQNWLDEEAQTAKSILKEAELWNSYEAILKDVQAYFSAHQTDFQQLPAGDCHLDYDSNNVLVEGGKITAILDFDDIACAPFILDCGNSLWWWLYFSEPKEYQDILQTYLRAYESIRGTSAAERHCLTFFIRLRNATLAPLLFVNDAKQVNKRAFRKAIAFDQVMQSTVNYF